MTRLTPSGSDEPTEADCLFEDEYRLISIHALILRQDQGKLFSGSREGYLNPFRENGYQVNFDQRASTIACIRDVVISKASDCRN